MTEHASPCPGHDVLVALALDELTGRDRATALEHLVGCPRCRAEVDGLTDTADQVLLAAPEAEPPAGFEATVLDRLAAESRSVAAARRRRWRRPVAGLVAAALAVVLVIAGVVGGRALDGDDPPAQVVSEAPMVTPDGRVVGGAWVHGDDLPWILVSVPGWEAWEDPAAPPREYHLQVGLDDGTTIDGGEIAFGEDGGTWGTATTLNASEIRRLAVVDGDGRLWCEARL